MKAKTEHQKKIIKLSKELPSLIKKIEVWTNDNLINKYYTTSYKSRYCTECNHKFKTNNVFDQKDTICPKCKKKLKFKQLSDLKYAEHFNTIAFVIKNHYQVVRLFETIKHLSKNNKPLFYTHEVMQYWISPKGKIEILAKEMNSSYYENWVFTSELEIRSNNNKRILYNHDGVLPGRKIITLLKRNGFKLIKKHPVYKIIKIILTNPHAETLIKAKQYSLFGFTIDNPMEIDKHWDSIKICLRNNYIVKDARMWIDHLVLLIRYNKDILNHKYVCPKDLTAEHNIYIAKEQRRIVKENHEKLKAKIGKEQIKYAKFIKKYIDLKIEEGNIKIEPLHNVKEFLEEGTRLHHCVFSNEYYKERNSLILSAKVNNKRTETIEIDLIEKKIKQMHGLQNKKSNYHKQIKELINNNIDKIKEIHKLVNLN